MWVLWCRALILFFFNFLFALWNPMDVSPAGGSSRIILGGLGVGV